MNRLTRRTRGTPPADTGTDWGARVKDLATMIAPTTAISALLIYFGYVGTRARFAYFGVNLDLTEMSTQSLILYGLEVVYVPAAVSLVAVLAAATCHALVGRLVHAPRLHRTALTVAAFAALAGVLLLARGVIGLLVAEVSQTEKPLTSPLALAFGPVLIRYAGWAAGTVLARGGNGWLQHPDLARLRRFVTTTVAGLVLVALFWAANGFASSFGQGRAFQDALDLPASPEVVLDTRQQLIDLPDGIIESPLPAEGDDAFRYRYRGLRLLLAAGDRLFLTPEHWTADSRTLVVPYDDQIRLQLDP